jgi:hypothetical protein
LAPPRPPSCRYVIILSDIFNQQVCSGSCAGIELAGDILPIACHRGYRI